MTNESANSGRPPAVDRATFQAELDKLRAREKAHTREGDAIAAARRRLPMVEIDASLELTGPDGPLTLLDAFEGRRQLIAYYSYALMDLTAYGRQEQWEDSPPGWPQECTNTRTDGGPPAWPPVPEWPAGRPIPQWPRLEAGHSDDLTAAP
jgi:predicted dithiol-disulfide oxidoreductase (DUF899 family)